jgi:hypothetical protein
MDMTFIAFCRPCVFHGMACSAHPMGNILAKTIYVTRNNPGFPVANFAFAFLIRLVRLMGKGYTIFHLDNFRVVSRKRGCCCE